MVKGRGKVKRSIVVEDRKWSKFSAWLTDPGRLRDRERGRGCQQYADVLARQLVPQFAEMNEAVHHLRDAETVAEVVERIVAVVLLNAQLQHTRARSYTPVTKTKKTAN